MRLLATGLVILLTSLFSFAQDGQETQEKKWHINGYLKNLFSINFTEPENLVDNLVHNRLNFEWFPDDHFTFYLQLRTRLFNGDLVKLVPNYIDFIDVNDDYWDLSWTVIDDRSTILHTMIDRIYLEFSKKDWEIKVGRQRINWGVNLVWNPNDLFNTYSFFDFDYEERPGSDAIRVKKYTGFASSVEVAANIHDDIDQTVISGMWKINKSGYDIQFIAGKSREDIALGIGWAGNIKTAGFKGEITYFEPYRDNLFSSALLASISADYSFESSLYLHFSFLFNSESRVDPPGGFFNLSSDTRLTARDLSPFRYSTFLQTSYQFHPLVTAGLALIYYPGGNGFFINPTITYSIITNLDFDAVGQFFFDQNIAGDYEAMAKLLFLRLKWSF